jgi:hypothetical protein
MDALGKSEIYDDAGFKRQKSLPLPTQRLVQTSSDADFRAMDALGKSEIYDEAVYSGPI